MRLISLLLIAGTASCGGDDGTPDAMSAVDVQSETGEAPCELTFECDDALYCNGVEQCAPNDESADDNGCIAGESPSCSEGMECDDELGLCTLCVRGGPNDRDNDGFCSSDCDDNNAAINPGADELCLIGTGDSASVDEDCNPATLGPDSDVDGHMLMGCCNHGVCGNDCNELSGEVNPEAEEICDGLDNDCDGEVDEGVLSTFYGDEDGDNYGDSDNVMLACALPRFHAATPGDCADDPSDDNPATGVIASEIHPNAEDTCDGLDNDCDMAIDERAEGEPACECIVVGEVRGCGPPAALDGVGICIRGTQTCNAQGEWSPCVDAVLPADVEACDVAGLDENCNGASNEGCDCVGTIEYVCDHLNGTCAFGVRRCNGLGEFGPCSIEASVERCGGGDEDCDGATDEAGAMDARSWYPSADGDSFGVTSGEVRACFQPEPVDGAVYVTSPGDCDDTNSTIHPGAEERCDGRDTDCSSGGGAIEAEDDDGDGHTATDYLGCVGGFPKDDCHDGKSNVHPGQLSYFATGYCPAAFPCSCNGRCNPYAFGTSCGFGCSVLSVGAQPRTYDYDCNGTDDGEPHGQACYTGIVNFSCSGCTRRGGFFYDDPAPCGGSVRFETCVSCGDRPRLCTASNSTVTLGCR